MVLNKFRLNSTVWIDVLLNVLCGFAGILFLIYLLIHDPVETKQIDSVAEVIITADWPNGIGNDIDLWILMPHDQAVGYNRKQDREVSLERDDLGHRESTTVDGKLVPKHVNHETLFMRGLREGQYVVNVHYYNDNGLNQCTEGPPQCDPATKSSSPRLPIQVPVRVQIIRLVPTYQLVHSVELLLEREGMELTAFRFFVDENGAISRVSDDPLPFVTRMKGQGTVQNPGQMMDDDPQGNHPPRGRGR